MAEHMNLKDLYVDELKDLWSANDQMAKALKKIAPKATNPKLKAMLDDSQEGIKAHTELLKSLIEGQDEKVEKEHCKGMEGLVTEAVKHAIDKAPQQGPALDSVIIAQYQRMTHYGIAGFGTVEAYAKALNLPADVQSLKAATKGIYAADDYGSQLAETAVNVAAVSA